MIKFGVDDNIENKIMKMNEKDTDEKKIKTVVNVTNPANNDNNTNYIIDVDNNGNETRTNATKQCYRKEITDHDIHLFIFICLKF